MNKKNKYILVGFLFLLLILGVFIFFFLKKEKVEFSDKIIKKTSFQKEILKDSKFDLMNFKTENKLDTDKIYSISRSICKFYDDYSIAIQSRYYKNLKNEVNTLKNKIKAKNNNEDFLYIFLPNMVNETCINNNDEFKEKYIMYLQSDEINIATDDNLKKDLFSFIDTISFKNIENIDKTKLKSDKNYFEDYFFKENNEELISMYYPFYIKEGKNINNFLNKPSNTLKEDLEFKNKIMSTLLLNLKILGFNSIEEFRDITKKHYNISDIEKYKNGLLNEFINYKKNLLSQGINIDTEFSNSISFNNYLLSGKYKDLFNDKNQEIFNKIGKELTLIIMLSNDYADGINETWSGKQFFGDDVNGNNLIKMYFIYILKQNTI